MAREILAVPASEVDCERQFGQARDLLAIRRYAMKVETMRIMMPLKGVFRSIGIVEKGTKSTVGLSNGLSVK